MTCASGYTGSATSITCTNGSWSQSSGCTATSSSCSSSPTQTGYVIAAGSSTSGATRTVTCASGYTGSATSITCTNGSWSQSSGCTSTSVCTTTTPEDNSGNNAVLINFYSNPNGGRDGDPCPVACATPVMSKWYKIADSNSDTCLQWPGNSGQNSMMHGTCHPDTSSYSYSQWTTCDCSGRCI